MKVLVLGSKEYPMGTNKGDDKLPSGGMEVYVDQISRRLVNKSGIELKIITRRFKDTRQYEKKGGIVIYRVPWINGFYFRNLSFNFSSFLKAFTLDFDVIWSHGLFSTFFGLILSFVKRKRLVAVAHGLAFSQPQYPKFLRAMLKILEKFVYSKPNCVIFLSNNDKNNFFRNLNVLPKKYEVIPTGIDLVKGDSRKLRKELRIAKNTKIITFVGRLIDVKGAKYLVEAVNKIRKQDFIVLIVGSGPEGKKLLYLVKKFKLENKVKFLGFRNDVIDILASTDIYVLPSLSEGLPVSLLEAKASGCAIVVTNIGLPIKNNYDGFVVPKEDSKEIYLAINKLMNNTSLRKKFGNNARNDIKINYSRGKVINKYKKLFNKI